MGSIRIEQREIRVWEKSEIVDSQVEIKNGIYTTKRVINSFLNSEIFSYEDFSVLCSFEDNFNETYLNIILFNDEKQLAYKMLSLNAGLDVEMRRLTSTDFLIVGQNNKNVDCLGEVSFCSIKDSGRVNERCVNFNVLKKLAVIGKKYVMVNAIEEMGDIDLITKNKGKEAPKQYIHSVTLFSSDGKIIKTFVDEKTEKMQNYDFKLIGSEMLVYKLEKSEKQVISELDMATLGLDTQN